MMANVRVCVCLLILLVNYKLVSAELTFGTSVWCNLFCEDGDSSDDDDYDIFDIFNVCAGCPSGSSTKPTPSTGQKPVQIMIPPANGLNLTVSSGSGGAFLMNLVPWAGGPAPAKPAGGSPAAPAASATAAPPPAATTAGAKPAATTAAATTKKK